MIFPLSISIFSVILFSEVYCYGLRPLSSELERTFTSMRTETNKTFVKQLAEEKLKISYNLRDSLVMEMKSLEAPLTEAIKRNEREEIETLMERLEDNIWPKIVETSKVIRDNLPDDAKRLEEYNVHNNHKEIADRLFSMAVIYQLENLPIF